MITPSFIAPGQPIRLSAVFRDANTGAYEDPTTLEFHLRSPNGSKTAYTYLSSADIVKDSTGNFHVDVTPDCSGRWRFRWVSTGVGAAASEGFFAVQKSKFVDNSDCYWDYS